MELPPRQAPFALGRGEGRTFDFANGNRVEVKIGEGQTEQRLTFIEGSHGPRTGPPRHIHDDTDEIFYVLEGSYAITCGETIFDASPGTFVFVPRGTSHRFEPGSEGGRMLLLYSPGGFEGYFEERHREEIQHGRGLRADRIDSLGRKYGMRLDGTR